MTHLVFAIGPVQGFISQARRTSDGWVSSSLLSLMAAVAAKAAKEATGLPSGNSPTIKEPSLETPLFRAVCAPHLEPGSIDGDTTVPSIPNTIVVEVASPEDAAELGQRMSAAVDAAWKALSDEAWHSFPESFRRGVSDLWHMQISTHWEFHWGWGANSTDAFKALSARKALRDSVPPPEVGIRCSVASDRVALWAKPSEPREGRRMRDEVARQWNAWHRPLLDSLEDAPRNLLKPDGEERLSAVALLKRVMPYCDNMLRRIWRAGKESPDHPHVFPSTSTVAVVSYRAQLVKRAMTDQSVASTVRAYLDALSSQRLKRRADPLGQFSANLEVARSKISTDLSRKEVDDLLRLDGDWYLFGDAVLHEFGSEIAEPTAISVPYRALMGALRSESEESLHDPPIYYALAALDGDSMGDFLREVEAVCKETTSVSHLLAQLAADAQETVRLNNGRLIYAGGDDVIALFPVVTNWGELDEPTDGPEDPAQGARQTVMDAVNELRLAFENAFERWRRDHWPAGRPWTPRTQSAGIVIAHHQAPLGRVIAGAHRLLSEWAKGKAGRNACAIQLHRRGDASTTFAARWSLSESDAGDGPSLAATMRALAQGMRSDTLSAGLAHRLRDHLDKLGADGPFAIEERRLWLLNILEKSGFVTSTTEEERESLAATLERVGRLSVGDEGVKGFTSAPALIARFLSGGGREVRLT